MKYWLDTEFIEDGKTIDLISIGIVAEDGREFYAENLDCDLNKASPWVQENVIPHLFSKNEDKKVRSSPWVLENMIPDLFSKSQDRRLGGDWIPGGGEGGVLSRKDIGTGVVDFCNPSKYGKPEFWADYCSYDWVALCQLFGVMMDLPEGFPMRINDIRQECERLGSPELPEQGAGQHNALEDARWNREIYEFLECFASGGFDFDRNGGTIRLAPDGNRWCALVGTDLQSGTAGFGRTPTEAFDMLMAGLQEMDTVLPDATALDWSTPAVLE